MEQTNSMMILLSLRNSKSEYVDGAAVEMLSIVRKCAVRISNSLEKAVSQLVQRQRRAANQVKLKQQLAGQIGLLMEQFLSRERPQFKLEAAEAVKDLANVGETLIETIERSLRQLQ
jgi:hypothetical protein